MFLKQSDISWLKPFPLFSGTSEGESYLVVTLLPRYIYLLVKILYDLCVVSISCVSTKISQCGKCEIKKHFHTTFRSLTFVCRMKGVKAKDINIPHLCYVSNVAWQRGRHRMWCCHEIQKCLLPYHQIHPQHSAIDKCLNLITCNFTGIQEIKNNNAEMANLQFRNSWKCVSFFSDGEQVESVTNFNFTLHVWTVSELIPTSSTWVCRALTDSCDGLICAWWGVNSDVSASTLLTPSLLLLSRLLFFMLSMFFRTDLVVLQREKCRRQGTLSQRHVLVLCSSCSLVHY